MIGKVRIIGLLGFFSSLIGLIVFPLYFDALTSVLEFLYTNAWGASFLRLPYALRLLVCSGIFALPHFAYAISSMETIFLRQWAYKLLLPSGISSAASVIVMGLFISRTIDLGLTRIVLFMAEMFVLGVLYFLLRLSRFPHSS